MQKSSSENSVNLTVDDAERNTSASTSQFVVDRGAASTLHEPLSVLPSCYIASLKHTNKHHEHITFWKANWRGYTPVISEAGGYCNAHDLQNLNDGIDCVAVPLEVVLALSTPTPYWKPGAQFYDVPGPVVDNTRANWNALVAGSIALGRAATKVKPEPFRGTRRAFAAPAETAASIKE